MYYCQSEISYKECLLKDYSKSYIEKPTKQFSAGNQNLFTGFLYLCSIYGALDTVNKNVSCNADICPTGSELRP